MAPHYVIVPNDEDDDDNNKANLPRNNNSWTAIVLASSFCHRSVQCSSIGLRTLNGQQRAATVGGQSSFCMQIHFYAITRAPIAFYPLCLWIHKNNQPPNNGIGVSTYAEVKSIVAACS